MNDNKGLITRRQTKTKLVSSQIEEAVTYRTNACQVYLYKTLGVSDISSGGLIIGVFVWASLYVCVCACVLACACVFLVL